MIDKICESFLEGRESAINAVIQHVKEEGSSGRFDVETSKFLKWLDNLKEGKWPYDSSM